MARNNVEKYKCIQTYIILFCWFSNWQIITGDGRVTIEGSGTKFIMEGQNLTIKCKHDHPTSNLMWYNSSKHQLTARVGLVHITHCQLIHIGSFESHLTLVNITTDSRGIYSCGGDDGTFDVDVIVLSVLTDQEGFSNIPYQYNLTCELSGFTHNLPLMYAWWHLPNGLLINSSISGFEVGTSSQNHWIWLLVDVKKNPGKYFCIFGLPTTEGSFFANGSFLFPVREQIQKDDDEHSSAWNFHRSVAFVVLLMVSVTLGAINNIYDSRMDCRDAR